jgi:HEAT repeat protein
VLEELATCGEPAAIPHLAPALVPGDQAVALAAARAISSMLGHASAEDLAQLDERLRGYSCWEPWHRLLPRDLSGWVGPGEHGTLLLQMASFHRSGYVREEAVRRLALRREGSELPYLLLRVTDWVYPVRRAALQAVMERIREDYIPHFVQNLALVLRLEQVERGRPDELLAAVTSLLIATSARGAMMAALRAPSRQVRRGAFQMLLAADADPTDLVLLAPRKVSDPVIRLWSLRSAATRMSGEPLLAVLRRLTADPAPAVRREALALLASAFPEHAGEPLVAALLDRAAMVRLQARFHVRQRGGLDFAQFYRDALATEVPRHLAAAIGGLVETGVKADAEPIAPYLEHGSPTVRRTAIRGVMGLGGAPYVSRVLERVGDVAPGVSRQAMQCLLPYVAAIGVTELWTRFELAALVHVRQNLVHMLAAMPKWDAIACRRQLQPQAGPSD